MFMAHLSKSSFTIFQNRWTRRSKATTRRKRVHRFVKSGLSSWIEPEWFVITSAKIYRSNEHTKNQLYFVEENSPALIHSTVILVAINNELCSIKTNDILRKNVSSSEIDQTLNRNQTETKRLANLFKMKLHVRVILTVNIDLQNRLINVQSGTVKHVAKYRKGNIAKTYVQFYDEKAVLKRIWTCIFAKSHFWVSMDKWEGNIKIHSKKNTLSAIKRIHFFSC